MAMYDRNTRSPQFSRTDGPIQSPRQEEQLPLGDLLRRFGQDAAALMRDEITLAKLELGESVRELTQDAAKLAIAAGAALIGALSLTAFLILALGDLFDNYWASALLVTIALLATAAVLARGAITHFKQNGPAPRQTVQTLMEDKQWASEAARNFKSKLKA
ncbi:MAG: phage holin family protein [Gemmatimonadota bacterium]